MTTKPPVPPFTKETAILKVQRAEDAWNSKDPIAVSLAYTLDSQWRNRNEIFCGRDAIQGFLTRKWQQEIDYKLQKELWAYSDNRIAVTFFYEWHNHHNDWFRSYGNELWEFNEQGLMQRRIASINDLSITPEERTL